ncbi:MAG: RT0821/Lpp0805 family surface protein [Alphaproteobacteria bacterium]
MKANRHVKTVAAVAVALALTACANSQGREKEFAGGLVGAGVGALAGSQIGDGRGQLAAVAIGTLLGAWAGSQIGRQLDERDRLLAGRAMSQAHAAPVGQTIVWDNPNSGNSGTITPVRDGTHTATGAYCREYQQTITVGGRTEDAYGTACRQPDGSWQIVSG